MDSSKKTIWIVVGIVAVLLLCCCGFMMLGGLAFLGMDDAAQDDAGPTEPAPAAEAPAVEDDDSIWEEAERLTRSYYPDYALSDLQEAGTEDGSWTVFHLRAASETIPGLEIAFVARRHVDGAAGEPLGGEDEYVDAETSALWLHDKLASGVYMFASPEGLFYDADPVHQLAQDRPGFIVVDTAVMTQMDIEFDLIGGGEWAGWDGSSHSVTSAWTWHLVDDVWEETSFE